MHTNTELQQQKTNTFTANMASQTSTYNQQTNFKTTFSILDIYGFKNAKNQITTKCTEMQMHTNVKSFTI